MNRNIKAALLVAAVPTAFLAGAGIMMGEAPPPEVITKTVEVEVPGETVTKRVEVPGPTKTVTKEVEVEVEVTPDSCLEALDLADEGFNITVEVLTATEKAFTAIEQGNLAMLEQAVVDIETANVKLEGLPQAYNLAKADCRAS